MVAARGGLRRPRRSSLAGLGLGLLCFRGPLAGSWGDRPGRCSCSASQAGEPKSRGKGAASVCAVPCCAVPCSAVLCGAALARQDGPGEGCRGRPPGPRAPAALTAAPPFVCGVVSSCRWLAQACVLGKRSCRAWWQAGDATLRLGPLAWGRCPQTGELRLVGCGQGTLHGGP